MANEAKSKLVEIDQVMRDRLIEVLKEILPTRGNASGIPVIQKWDYNATADKLLENGVILPPCKVGDTIFVIPSKVNYKLNILHNRKENNRVYEQVIDHITIWESDYMLYTCDGLCAVRSKAYKDTWFLTKEDAERALKERGSDE